MQISVADGYRLWAQSYDSVPNPLLALESRLMRGLLQGTNPARVVDLACGTARWARHFEERNATVFAIDFCDEMLNVARQHEGVRDRLVLGDALHLPLRSASADLVLCSFALGHFRDLRQAFAEMARVAGSGAVVAISDVHPEAIEAGWTGSFRIGDTAYSITNCRYSLFAVRAAAEAARLKLVSHTQAHLSSHERPILETAGKADRLEALREIPALWAGVWEKS